MLATCWLRKGISPCGAEVACPLGRRQNRMAGQGVRAIKPASAAIMERFGEGSPEAQGGHVSRRKNPEKASQLSYIMSPIRRKVTFCARSTGAGPPGRGQGCRLGEGGIVPARHGTARRSTCTRCPMRRCQVPPPAAQPNSTHQAPQPAHAHRSAAAISCLPFPPGPPSATPKRALLTSSLPAIAFWPNALSAMRSKA